MCTSQYTCQSSLDLNEYLPNELTFEDTKYQSCEELIRAFKADTFSLAHRHQSPPFDQIFDDMEAFSALESDSSIFACSATTDEDDIATYLCEQSRAVPHMPTASQQTVSFPLSPLSIDNHQNQRNNIQPPCSPVNSNHIQISNFLIYDKTTGKERRPFLHEFIRVMLENDEYSHIVQYVDRKRGIFKLYRPHDVAELWKLVKGRNSDNGK